jgi:hypothetical protein
MELLLGRISSCSVQFHFSYKRVSQNYLDPHAKFARIATTLCCSKVSLVLDPEFDP